MNSESGSRTCVPARIFYRPYPVHFWISILCFFAGVHLVLLALGGANSGDLVVAVIGWLLVVLLFAGTGSDLNLSGWSAALSGIILLSFGLLQTYRMAGFDLWYLKILPFLLLFGVLLLSSGWAALVSQWRLTALLLVVSAPEKYLEFLNHGGHLILAHTWVAGFLLHCIGSEVVIHGNMLALPAGSVEVQEACSGLVMMLLLLKIALLVSIALPIRFPQRILMCAAALLTGFAVGVIRVAVLAAIVYRRDWFAQMHGPAGMSLFPMLGFLLFTPALLPADKPFVELLQKVRMNWCAASPFQCGGWRLVFPTVAGIIFGICVVKTIWIQSPTSFLPLDVRAASILPDRMERRQVPDGLSASRFNRIQGAWRREGRDQGVRTTTLVCAMSGALLAPAELISDPIIARFIDVQLGGSILASPESSDSILWKISGSNNGPAHAVALIPGGSISVRAIDVDGDSFFSATEYAAAQRSTLFRFSTWKDFVKTGRPLKDLRYWLIVVVSETKP
ncbi:MAG: exosortase/archaeosortase family protein [Verrucomicrobiota bacterium]